MVIPESVIQDVVDKCDIVDIVSQYVKLKKNGATLFGLCPFHNEKTPSFSVSPDKQLYYCFGCSKGGTVINFMMDMEGLDFVESVKLLASKANIIIPEKNDGDSQAFHEKKKRLYHAGSAAGKLFYRYLKSELGNSARKYLFSRDLSSETIAKFGIGFAIDSWDTLINDMKKLGFTDEELLQAGLVSKSEKSDRCFDRFRNRIMFPIIDLRGNVVGFGGRVLDESQPKYLNSPETVIFDKSANLFNLNHAKNNNGGKIILVEGYMDVITLSQNGVANSVACLGTSFAEKQARLIKRFCEEVIICFDSDNAGKIAADRAVRILNQNDVRARVVALKGAKDPDEYCKKYGVLSFKKAVDSAKTPILFKIDSLLLGYDLNDAAQKIAFINQISPEFVTIQSAVEREIYMKQVAQTTGVSYEAILSEVKKAFAKSFNKEKRQEKMKTTQMVIQKSLGASGKKMQIEDAQSKLLCLMFYDTGVAKKVMTQLPKEEFEGEIYQRFANFLFATLEEGKPPTEASLLLKFEKEDAGKISKILSETLEYDNNLAAAFDLVNYIKDQRKTRNLLALAKDGNLKMIDELLKEKAKNTRKEGSEDEYAGGEKANH